MNPKVTQDLTLPSLPVVSTFYPSAISSTSQLTDAQLVRLYKCANGNTLRFEAASIVDALVASGYAKEGVGRVVTVTAKGQQYLRTHTVRIRLAQLGAAG
jgi:hypothetical protein